jgi:hypothetical protein
MLNFFKNGGVFLFDENNAASERTFYKLEDLMGEEAGEDIVETYVGPDDELCIYYDCSVISEEDAVEKYNNGDYVISL